MVKKSIGFCKRIHRPHFSTSSNSLSLQFSSLTISAFISITVFSPGALVTLNIRHNRALFSPLPRGTEVFVKQLIRIADGSPRDSEVVVHHKHSTQTGCFTVSPLHSIYLHLIFSHFSSPLPISSTKWLNGCLKMQPILQSGLLFIPRWF